MSTKKTVTIFLADDHEMILYARRNQHSNASP